MRCWTVDPVHPDPAILAEAAALIRGGGVVVFPTDTLYGLAADPVNEEAVRKVFEVKGRSAGEPLPLVVAGVEEAGRAGKLTPLAVRLAARFWPGPLTLVLEEAGVVAAGVHAGTGSVGVRVPASAVATGLARMAGGLLTATSANRSGAPAPASAAEAAIALGREVDGLLDGGPAPGGPPSTVVDARGKVPALIRAGAIAYDRILEAV